MSERLQQMEKLESRVADVLADELNTQQAVDEEMRDLIAERTRHLQEAIVDETAKNAQTVNNLQDCLQI